MTATPDTTRPSLRVVAVIPARGGSKGIPGKNLRRVGGVTLVERAVSSALAATGIDAVYVSTDDEVIARTAIAAGAEVIMRPSDISGDRASSEAALLHALDAMGTDPDGADPGSADPDILVFIQATSPFIDPDELEAAIERVAAGEADVVFSARRSHAFLWRDSADGATGINHDASFRLRRQDSEPQYLETGAFYVMDAAGFRKSKFRFFGRVGLAVVPDVSAIEVDSPDDLRLAQAIAALIDQPSPIDVDAVVTDFDGVHTDDRAHMDADGVEFVTVSRSDGMGVELMRQAGLRILILSKETNPVVTARAAKLRVEARQSIEDKSAVLRSWAIEHGLDLARVAYLGNDVNDLACMELVGWPAAVADAHPAVLASARVVLSRPGGRGAVRELADRVLNGSRTSALPKEKS